MKLYLAGPMTGIPEFNFPAFDAAAKKLRAAGHTVFNPAENDRENGFDATGLSGNALEAARLGFDLRLALKQDLSWICDHAEGIALLPNWHSSKGVRAEVALAEALGISLQYWHYHAERPVVPEVTEGVEFHVGAGFVIA